MTTPITPEQRRDLMGQLNGTSGWESPKWDGVPSIARSYEAALTAAEAERDRLQDFKDWTHGRLTLMGVPKNPDPGKTESTGCRIGGRMNWLEQQKAMAEAARDAAIAALRAYETWEGNLVMSSDAWQGSLPMLTQKLYDELMACQEKRNAVLRAVVEAERKDGHQ